MKYAENKDWITLQLESFISMYKYRKEESNMNDYDIINLFVKDNIDMENGMNDYYNYLRECTRRNTRLLKAIKSIRGKTFHKYVLQIIEDSDRVEHLMEIVSVPVGEFQKENYGRQIKGIYVNQWSVGDSGDSWHGTICIEIKQNKFLKFGYEM